MPNSDAAAIAELLASGATAASVEATIQTPQVLTRDEKLMALSCVLMGKSKMDAANPPAVGDYLTRTSPDLDLFLVTEINDAESLEDGTKEYTVTLELARGRGSPRLFQLSELTSRNSDGASFIRVMPGIFGISFTR